MLLNIRYFQFAHLADAEQMTLFFFGMKAIEQLYFKFNL